MAKAQTDFKKLRWVAEASFGAGAAGAKQQDVRFETEDLRLRENQRESAEILGTQQVGAHHRTRQWVEGTFESEFLADEFDTWMQYAMRSSAWSSLVSETDTTYSMTDVDNSINDSATGFVVDGFVANQWVYISGFTTTANNGWAKTSTVAAGKIVLLGIDVADEAAGDTVTIKMVPQLVGPGTDDTSFALEREYSDVESEFREFQGCRIEAMRITVNDDDIVTIGFDIMGKTEVVNAATAGDGSPTAVGTTAAFKTDDDLEFLYENNASAEGITFDISVTNGLRHRGEIGTTGPADFGTSRFRADGSYSAVYESKTLYNKYINETLTSFAVAVTDPAGNSYVFEVIQARLGEADTTGGGTETDVEIQTPFMGERDATELYTFRIAKLSA